MKSAEVLLNSIQKPLGGIFSGIQVLLRPTQFLVVLTISFATCAFADMRFDNFCVTAPGSKLVLIYDDLNLERNPTLPPELNQVDNVTVYDFNRLGMPTDFNLKWHGPWIIVEPNAKEWPKPTVYVDSTWAGAYILNAGKIVKGSDLVQMRDGKITVRKGNKILFTFPFIIQPDAGNAKFKTIHWEGENLIFDGKEVKSVTYHDCGMGAD